MVGWKGGRNWTYLVLPQQLIEVLGRLEGFRGLVAVVFRFDGRAPFLEGSIILVLQTALDHVVAGNIEQAEGLIRSYSRLSSVFSSHSSGPLAGSSTGVKRSLPSSPPLHYSDQGDG
jgi:hypothetical protein